MNKLTKRQLKLILEIYLDQAKFDLEDFEQESARTFAAVPTLIKEDNGVEIDRHVGIMTEKQLKHWCND